MNGFCAYFNIFFRNDNPIRLRSVPDTKRKDKNKKINLNDFNLYRFVFPPPLNPWDYKNINENIF